MKARSTFSGTTSVLIEPCRKKLKSLFDHEGTWAISGLAIAACISGTDNKSEQVINMMRKQTANLPKKVLDFMLSERVANQPKL